MQEFNNLKQTRRDFRVSTDDVPTPKISAQWEIFATAADEIAEKLRISSIEFRGIGQNMNAMKSHYCKYFYELALKYKKDFESWKTSTVSIESKHKSQREFLAFDLFVKEYISNE